MKGYLGVVLALGASLCNAAPTPPAGDPTISTSLYDDFYRITLYAAAAYADSCTTPPNRAVAVKYFNINSASAHAILFRDDARRELVIAFRGTSSLLDFGTDFNINSAALNAVGTSCSACTVHAGSLGAWNSIANEVVSAMKSEFMSHPGYKPIVTGHSLGGAIASIASASLVSVFPTLTSYTLGQFRTGNQAYADYIDRILPFPNMYRITHTSDGVPAIIGAGDNYAHHSTEHWQLDPAGASSTYMCKPGDDMECNASAGGVGINGPHLCYSGISIGNPLDGGKSVCGGQIMKC